MSRIQYYILAGCILIVALHLWGFIDTSHANWGVHFYGFYKPEILILGIALLILLAIPAFQSAIVQRLEKMLRWLGRFPATIIFIAVAGIIITGIFLFPAQLHLLGDGAVLLRSVPRGITGDEITLSFRNQPLMFWIYRTTTGFHTVDGTINPYEIYLTIDIIAVVLFLGLLFWGMKRIQRPPIERFLFGCFILFNAGSQFFFGYVENYVLQYVVTIAFMITGWYSLEKRIHILAPISLFLFLVLLHLGNIVFLPSLILLILLTWKKRKVYAVLLLAGVSVLGVAGLLFAGFNIIDMTRHLQSGTVDFLQPFTAAGGNFPYPMFSFRHLSDWLNSSLLTAPFGLLVPLILIPVLPKERRWKNPILLFLLSAAGCGMFFTWVINSALGLARDWDLFSNFFAPSLVLTIYLFIQFPALPRRMYLIVLIAGITLFHTIPWIGINASAERHLARFKTLNSPTFLSKSTELTYDEALANFFFDSQKYADARTYYEHFLTIDSTNPRIIGNISDVYRRVGDRDKYFHMLVRAVALNSLDPGVYSNLGVEYANRGDTSNAIRYNEIAVKMNPTSQKAYANLGVLYSSKKDYEAADRYFTTAINLGMREPMVFRYAGDVAAIRGDFKRAIDYYDTYLSTQPTDRRIRMSRERVLKILQNKK